MKRDRFIKNILAVLGIVAAAFVVMNAGWFRARLNHRLDVMDRAVAPDSATAPAPAPLIMPTSGPDRLAIPSLGIDAPLVYIDERSEAAYQKALQGGVVHFPDTALPGEYGNAYYFGHSSDYVWAKGDYKTVFALLPEIMPGADILISDRSGRIYVYRVTETKIVGPKDVSVLDQGGNERRLLSLQTSYPIGTALRRFVVVAELVTP